MSIHNRTFNRVLLSIGFEMRIVGIILVLLSSTSMANQIMEVVNTVEGPISPNYCNQSELLEEAGLVKSTLGQFLGYACSEEFYHCRWQSDGFRTYRKKCNPGLVYDVFGTQNCNYDYNVKSCGIRRGGESKQCNSTDFHCPLSEQCVPMSARCDGHYDCGLEEDEQNCPLCTAGEFACKVSEQCIPLDRRCNGLTECDDGTDEQNCDICGNGFFHCSKSNECVPIDERCDGRRQCPHGEDEMLCKKSDIEKKFLCQSRDFELPYTQVCDGRPQCPDGSDELYCEIPNSMSGGAGMSFSKQVPPAPVIPKEEKPADYDYESVEEDDEKDAAFPMLTLINLPSPTTTTTTTEAPRPRKPVFSRPAPKINNVMEVMRKKIPTTTAATTIPTTTTTRRIKQRVKPSASTSIGTDLRVPSKPANEKVFIMQVTASPKKQIEITTRTTKKKIAAIDENRSDILNKIAEQLNGGINDELVAQIESIINNRAVTPQTIRRRKPTGLQQMTAMLNRLANNIE